jgi:hypothetical protein
MGFNSGLKVLMRNKDIDVYAVVEDLFQFVELNVKTIKTKHLKKSRTSKF